MSEISFPKIIFFSTLPKSNWFLALLDQVVENISDVKAKNDPSLEEGIFSGFASLHEMIQVLYYCVVYAKYYIYIQRLYNNNVLDLYAYLAKLKKAL